MIPVVHVGVDIDRPAVLVNAPAVRLVDGQLLLVGVTDGQTRDVLPARDDDDDAEDTDDGDNEDFDDVEDNGNDDDDNDNDDDDEDNDDADDDDDTCKSTGRSCPRRHGAGSW